MEFRKIDQNRVSMNLAEVDIVEYVRRICDYFRALFESKGLQLVCDLPGETIVMTFDPEKIELALYNLLQNAYTFTHPGGEVCVSLRRSGRTVCIAVHDTGIGIRSEYLDKIFLRFWQVHESDTMPPLGAGIGWLWPGSSSRCTTAASRLRAVTAPEAPLPSACHWRPVTRPSSTISTSRTRRTRSRFCRSTPSSTPSRMSMSRTIPASTSRSPARSMSWPAAATSTGLVRMVLSDYNVLHYNNVEDTLRAVRERRPQLILIDIVVYDREEGLALCRKHKGSKQTDDIPVVLLTADDTPEDARIFCEAGVDAWMEKPFDVELFRARVRQLVSRHVDLQQKLKIGQILGKHEDIVVESADEKFMSRVTEIVEQNIPNEEFSLEVFAREMRVSRSVLNMRIQGIVGKSPMELLRNARMQRAAQLLATNAYDVAQVGYMVGFSDPRYFSTSFKKQFGVSPRAYMQNHHNA